MGDTYRRLRRMVTLTLVLTAAVWLAATTLLLGSRATIASAAEEANPALLASLAAHAALSDTDRAAWQSFRGGEVKLTGPGRRYRDDITTAGENLVRLAELDTTGTAGRQALLAVNGQLVTYQGLVEQADASYRQGADDLGYAYLTYSSNLLHGPGGLLSRIEDMAELNRRAIERSHTSPWVDPGTPLVALLAAGVLLGHLLRVQVFLSRAFRRTINPPLLAATLVLCVLAIWTTLALNGGHQAFRSAERQALPALSQVWQTQIRRADLGTAALRANASRVASAEPDLTAAEPARARLDTLMARALDSGGLMAGLPIGAVAVAVLATAGLRLRLNEFRG
ncbi:hypothetical protein ABZU32_15960 [Sphaerisporangium sp. NPDC005288]|uniref:hypothetical protein n=1 Tax=Sphaerisporangium sp. NPDC005288 TaxID=3155114 RepID=UPI00339DBDDC